MNMKKLGTCICTDTSIPIIQLRNGWNKIIYPLGIKTRMKINFYFMNVIIKFILTRYCEYETSI